MIPSKIYIAICMLMFAVHGYAANEKSIDIFKKIGDQETVLAVQPHYDDNDIFASGFLSLLAAKGVKIIYLTITDDKVGVIDQTLSDKEMEKKLRKEQFNAASVAGGNIQHEWLNLPDAGQYDYFALRTAIIERIRKYKPTLVITCDPWLKNEAHNDHLMTGRATAEAVLLYPFKRIKTNSDVDDAFENYDLKWIAFYATSDANAFADISKVISKKTEIIDQYQLQFSKEDHIALMDYLQQMSTQTGKTNDVKHAEGFKVLARQQLHAYIL